MCWVACDRGARLAALRDDGERAERWSAAAEEIHADVCAQGAVHDGVFRQHYDTEALDASCLLLPLVHFLPPDDARIVDTVLAILDEPRGRRPGPRYRVEETDDGLVGPRGPFAMCSFWMVGALVEIGELERARALCEKVLSLRLAARPVRRGDRRPARPPARQLPAGLHPPLADQRGDARRTRRGGAARRNAFGRQGRRPAAARQRVSAPAFIAAGDAEDAARRGADLLAGALRTACAERGAAHLALSGGTTPGRCYELLGREPLNWPLVNIWLCDERCVPADDERSNLRLAREKLGPAAQAARWHAVDGELSPA